MWIWMEEAGDDRTNWEIRTDKYIMLLLFSCQVMSNSLQPHWLQHARLPCPSPSPEVCPSSCPLNQWCHPTISSSVTLFSFCLQSFPASMPFPMSQFFPSGSQSIGASASVLPVSIHHWFPLGLTDLPAVQWTFKSLLAPQFESINSLALSLLYGPTLAPVHDYWKKTMSLTIWTLLAKWCLCFLICCLALSQLSFQEAVTFNFMTAVTIHSDFWSPRK